MGTCKQLANWKESVREVPCRKSYRQKVTHKILTVISRIDLAINSVNNLEAQSEEIIKLGEWGKESRERIECQKDRRGCRPVCVPKVDKPLDQTLQKRMLLGLNKNGAYKFWTGTV
jgi:hypothetical protein